MKNSIKPADAPLDRVARRIARKCRHIVQGCLREEEWLEADREFFRVAREELEGFRTTKGRHPSR